MLEKLKAKVGDFLSEAALTYRNGQATLLFRDLEPKDLERLEERMAEHLAKMDERVQSERNMLDERFSNSSAQFKNKPDQKG